MEEYRERYARWLSSEAVAEATKEELRAIASDEKLGASIALITDGRFSGASKGPAIGHVSPEAAQDQLTRTNDAVQAACGSAPTVFRPCYGATNDTVNSLAQMPVIMWSIDTLDWKTKDAQKTFDCIKTKADQGKLDGKIVLMHSIHEPTAEATEMIVPWLKENGYQMVTVSELIKYKRGEDPQNGKVYF